MTPERLKFFEDWASFKRIEDGRELVRELIEEVRILSHDLDTYRTALEENDARLIAERDEARNGGEHLLKQHARLREAVEKARDTFQDMEQEWSFFAQAAGHSMRAMRDVLEENQ